tara:strand:+ start:802 stop:1398 length:597 start_codon:yes stop_codon:yes gene_type:complete
MILHILKNAHSSLEYYDDTQTDLCPNVNWCVWREPWQRFISGVWTDVVNRQKLDEPNTKNYSVDEVLNKIMNKDWVRQQVEGNGPETMYYNAGHMISQWNNLQTECHRRRLSEGNIRIYGSVKTATKIHYNIEIPHKINVSPPDVIKKIRDILIPYKVSIINDWLQEDYKIWDQLDPTLIRNHTPFIDVPVDKIRKDI